MRRYNEQIEDAYAGSKRQGDLMRNRDIEHSAGQDRRNRYRDDKYQLQHSPSENADHGDDQEYDSRGRYVGTRGGEYTDYADTSKQDKNYRGYSDEDYPYYNERMKQSNYPDTYRSAMGGYMHTYVGDDSGRKDSSYGAQNVKGGLHKGKGPRNYKRSDQRITEEIHERLTDDSYIDATEINIEVQNGEVILTGSVYDRSEKRRAENIIESVSGVTQVENRLRVSNSVKA